MISREEISELAQFEDRDSCALTYYFQPSTPRNKAHKEEAILTKDLAREALRELERQSLDGDGKIQQKYEAARADLDRIMRLSRDLLSTRGNGTHAKAVFACSSRNFWREYELPAQLGETELRVDRHFRLKPLAHLLGAFPSLGIVLVDRHRARLFDLRLGELTEREGFFHPLLRRGRSDGFAGYDGGHAQRRAADEVLHHLKAVAEVVKDAIEKGIFERWILGCQETLCAQMEAHLHPYASQRLIGRFPSELGHVSVIDVRQQAEDIFSGWQEEQCKQALRETLSQARANARGVTGLRRVLQALEAGKVQTLLLGENYHAQAVECSGCGHLDAHLVNFCPACGRETRQVVDVAEAILPWVIRRNVELFYVKDDPEFDKVGNIAALLRYRSGQNSNLRSIEERRGNPAANRNRREGFLARPGSIDERMIL